MAGRSADQPAGGSGGVHSACAISSGSSWRRRRWWRRWLQRGAARGAKPWASRGDLATDWRARTCTRSPREPTVRGAPTERRARSFDDEDTNHAPRRAERAGAFFVFAGLSLAMGSRHVESRSELRPRPRVVSTIGSIAREIPASISQLPERWSEDIVGAACCSRAGLYVPPHLAAIYQTSVISTWALTPCGIIRALEIAPMLAAIFGLERCLSEERFGSLRDCVSRSSILETNIRRFIAVYPGTGVRHIPHFRGLIFSSFSSCYLARLPFPSYCFLRARRSFRAGLLGFSARSRSFSLSGIFGYLVTRVPLRRRTRDDAVLHACWKRPLRIYHGVNYAVLINFTKRIGRALIRDPSKRPAQAPCGGFHIVVINSALRGTAVLKYIRVRARRKFMPMLVPMRAGLEHFAISRNVY